jgi:hypothetical protein
MFVYSSQDTVHVVPADVIRFILVPYFLAEKKLNFEFIQQHGF